jgi:hypothetical protein
MTDITHKHLCQISDSGCQLLTKTDTETAGPRRRRHRQHAWQPPRKQRHSIHLRKEPCLKTEPICRRNLGLEVEYPRKTLPWTDNSCQIAPTRDTSIVCPSPLDIIGCETPVGRNLECLAQTKVVTTGRTPDIEFTTDLPSRRTQPALARQKFRWISCQQVIHDEQRRIEHAHV